VQLAEQDAEFRQRARRWLEQNLTAESAELRGLGGPGREHQHFDQRLAWNWHLPESGWTCTIADRALGLPRQPRG
jgi:hypothetical protein